MALRFIEPMKPKLVSSPPEGEDWQHEIKHDGFRTQLVIAEGSIRAYSSGGHDWTTRYPAIVAAASELGCSSAIIDGEAIVQDDEGRSDYAAFKQALARRPEAIFLMAFDLLHLDGRDLRRAALAERREQLRSLLAGDDNCCIRFSDHVTGNGAAMLEAAERMGLEGIVSKRAGSRYRSGTSKDWLKIKCYAEGEFVVIGTSKGRFAPEAILARETEDGRLEHAGEAMVTFSEAEREAFWRANEQLKTSEPAIPMAPRPETSWLRPEMRVVVKHLRGEEKLRHATVKSIAHLPKPPTPPRKAIRKRSEEPAHHVEPGSVPQQEALLAYYEAVGAVMLPHIRGRPLNLFRCRGRYCFFQRNRNHPQTEELFEEPIHKVPVLQKNGRTEDYLYVDSVEGLIACARTGAVEIHAWGSRVPGYEQPDRIALDLDPGEGISFDDVKDAALQLMRSLEALGLRSWPLLTGGKGIHVVIPLQPEHEWPEVREFARSFCAALAEAAPERFTIAQRISDRRGRIFLDYLRNQRVHTAIMPYSLRARPGSPVAAPIAWDELQNMGGADAFKIDDVDALIARASSRALKNWGEADQRLPSLGGR